MTLRAYLLIWLLITAILGIEYYGLNNNPSLSILSLLRIFNIYPVGTNISPEPGRPISYFLGWTGFGIMLLTNLYIIRKRLGIGKSLGTMSGWMDFHILCGLLGPTLIIFHSNFTVHGLVAISFWSMIISASSGIIGRYFYLQVAGKKADHERNAELISEKLKVLMKADLSPEANRRLENAKEETKLLVGGNTLVMQNEVGIFKTLFSSFLGDLRRKIFSRSRYSPEVQILLTEYALSKRRALYYVPFQRIMGYWHSFHLPFAVFMYVVAIIHIISALFFGVNK